MPILTVIRYRFDRVILTGYFRGTYAHTPIVTGTTTINR